MNTENPNLKKPKYTIGVLLYHRTPELVQMARDCIASIKSSSKNYELLIIDNHSTEQYPWDEECDTYVRFNKNHGISYGWNTVLKLARGEYIVLLGDDTLVREGWLEALEEAIKMPEAGVANVYVEHLPQGIGIVEDYKWFAGSCFMLTQKTIDKVGYFDEEIFPCNTEDWDYWIRVYKTGLKLYKNFGVSIQHLEGATVHAYDLSRHTEMLLDRLRKKYGFDPTAVFCGDIPIQKAITKTW